MSNAIKTNTLPSLESTRRLLAANAKMQNQLAPKASAGALELKTTFIEQPQHPSIALLQAALEEIFTSDRAAFHGIFAGSDFIPTIPNARSYDDIRSQVNAEVKFIFDAANSGRVIYLWIEERSFPISVRTASEFSRSLTLERGGLLRRLNRILVDEKAKAELNRPPLVVDKRTLSKRFAWLGNLYDQHRPQLESKKRFERFAKAVIDGKILVVWKDSGDWPILHRPSTPPSGSTLDPTLAELGTQTIDEIAEIRQIVERPPENRHAANLVIVQQLFSKLEAQNPKRFKKTSVNNLLLFQNAVLNGKISFTWAPGREFPARYNVSEDYWKALTQAQRKDLTALLESLAVGLVR